MRWSSPGTTAPGQRTPARAASRHSRRKGNTRREAPYICTGKRQRYEISRCASDRSGVDTYETYGAHRGGREHPGMREAATEEGDGHRDAKRRPRLPGRRVSLRSSWIASSPCARGRPCLGRAAANPGRSAARDIRHTEVQRTLRTPSRRQPDHRPLSLDDAEKEAAHV